MGPPGPPMGPAGGPHGPNWPNLGPGSPGSLDEPSTEHVENTVVRGVQEVGEWTLEKDLKWPKHEDLGMRWPRHEDLDIG